MTVYNKVNTNGVNFTLDVGIYTFKLGAIQTKDQSDLVSIIGIGNWQYSTNNVTFNTPLFGDTNTYYADELLSGLTLTIKVLEVTEFTVKTEDTFDFPFDDLPTNPLIDLEVLGDGDISTIAEDSIGNVMNNIISTLNGVSLVTLESDFLRTDLPFGIEGSGVLYVTDPSSNLVNVNFQEDNGAVFFWNGIEGIELDLTEGNNQLLLNPVSDEWGFIVVDKFKASDINILTVESIKLVESNFTENYVNVYSLGDINEIDLLENTYEIGTGTGDRSVRTISNNLMGDKAYLSSLGTEGSYFELTGLNNGVYSFEIETLRRIDNSNNDALYVWNGKDLTLVADNENGVITNEVDVIYNELSFIALDATTKTGTTEFTIANISKQSELPYIPPERIDLIPDNYLGDVDFYPNQTRISNGSGDRSISIIGDELGINLTGLGTEGSYATWDVENGKYSVTYSLYASENDFDHDDIYFYDGESLQLFDSRSSATIQSSATRWVSESKTAEVEVTGGELSLITLDTVDKSGTTQLRITNIEKLAEENNPYEYIYEEPPFPIPETGKDLDLDLGILKPWETDDLTGTEYNQGYVYPSYHLGASYISEYIGGDDLSDRLEFSLNEDSYINFFHNNVIAEILDSNNQVIIGSNDSYSGNLQAFLTSGDYSIAFSSESSIKELFSASIYLSNSDPNYAD